MNDSSKFFTTWKTFPSPIHAGRNRQISGNNHSSGILSRSVAKTVEGMDLEKIREPKTHSLLGSTVSTQDGFIKQQNYSSFKIPSGPKVKFSFFPTNTTTTTITTTTSPKRQDLQTLNKHNNGLVIFPFLFLFYLFLLFCSLLFFLFPFLSIVFPFDFFFFSSS